MVIDLDETLEIHPYQIESMKRINKLNDMERENLKLRELFKSFEETYRKNEGIDHD